jgi:hypothetical protein
MLLRVVPGPSQLAVCAEQDNIVGASRGAPEPLAVCRCERPVLLTHTARISQLESGLRDTGLSLY